MAYRLWGIGAGFCWLTALMLVFWPVSVGGASTQESVVRCGRPLAVALDPEPGECQERAAARMGALSVWLVLTGAVSTMYLARCALARPETPRDE